MKTDIGPVCIETAKSSVPENALFGMIR
jgi:hypothetical protein